MFLHNFVVSCSVSQMKKNKFDHKTLKPRTTFFNVDLGIEFLPLCHICVLCNFILHSYIVSQSTDFLNQEQIMSEYWAYLGQSVD